jgi:7-carboxy-7-deazaguanine synthase
LCYFIRLAGCRLRCAWCDTLQAQPHDCGKEYSAAELTDLALASGIPLVEVTGGEPLEQPEAVIAAMQELFARAEVGHL